jgi:hypothetical protein
MMEKKNLKKKKLIKIIKMFNQLKSDKIFFQIYIVFSIMKIIRIHKEKFKHQKLTMNKSWNQILILCKDLEMVKEKFKVLEVIKRRHQKQCQDQKQYIKVNKFNKLVILRHQRSKYKSLEYKTKDNKLKNWIYHNLQNNKNLE